MSEYLIMVLHREAFVVEVLDAPRDGFLQHVLFNYLLTAVFDAENVPAKDILHVTIEGIQGAILPCFHILEDLE